jgi:lipopolysaccharide/colanic/teichoic acid biosynthesis glycosyltransferase
MQLALKRGFDIALALLLLVMAAPVLLLLYFYIRTRLGAPVFFTQTRIGKDEREFQLIKFRSMTQAKDANGALLPDHLRLHAFGSWLRSTSLDEVPELWNILVGEMSFVGPRPLLPDYLPYYRKEEKIRHQMLPGITGLAQINGRNATTWDARLAYDRDYVENFSLALDARILWRTVMVVLKREGISAEGHATMRRLDDERRGITSPRRGEDGRGALPGTMEHITPPP